MNTKHIEKIDRDVCKDIRTELQSELASVGDRLGLSLRMGGCRYSNDSATFKLEVELLSESGRPVSKEEKYLNENHERLEIPKAWLGAKLKDPKDGKLYYLRGYKVRSPKRPFLIEDVRTGTTYVTTKLGVKKLFLYQL
jgi:hypothetical protein